jgi:hypothetical protein
LELLTGQTWRHRILLEWSVYHGRGDKGREIIRRVGGHNTRHPFM